MYQLEYLPLQMSTAQSLQRLLSALHSLSLSKDLQLEITAIQTPVQAAGAGAGVVLTSSGLSCCPPFSVWNWPPLLPRSMEPQSGCTHSVAIWPLTICRHEESVTCLVSGNLVAMSCSASL